MTARRINGCEIHSGEALAVLSSLPSGVADLVLTDPPYSSGGLYRGDRVASPISKYLSSDSKSGHALHDFTGDSRDQRSFLFWSTLWLSQCLRVAKRGALCAVFSDWRQLPTVTDALQAAGWVWRGVAVWAKPNCCARPQLGRYANACEYVIWGSAGSRPIAGVAAPGVFQHAPPRGAQRIHPTEKPVALMRDLLRVAPPGGLVLDPFLGSGTTAVACVESGIRCIGIELSPEFFAIACNRVAKAAAA